MFHQGLAATRHPEEEALGLFPFVLPAVQAQVLDAELLLRVIKDKIVLFFFSLPLIDALIDPSRCDTVKFKFNQFFSSLFFNSWVMHSTLVLGRCRRCLR